MKIDVISVAVFVFCLGVCITLIAELKSSHQATTPSLVAESH